LGRRKFHQSVSEKENVPNIQTRGKGGRGDWRAPSVRKTDLGEKGKEKRKE